MQNLSQLDTNEHLCIFKIGSSFVEVVLVEKSGNTLFAAYSPRPKTKQNNYPYNGIASIFVTMHFNLMFQMAEPMVGIFPHEGVGGRRPRWRPWVSKWSMTGLMAYLPHPSLFLSKFLAENGK
jgi:hypothetical protein